MTESTSTHNQDVIPSLLQDRSFWGLNLTQFLGAFNDNLFKQLVLYLCLEQAKKGGRDLQGIALVLFAVPFIFISGYAGYLSDRYSKRTIIVLCKVAEVLIVLLGMIGFVIGSLPYLLFVLCLMGVHSAFFGPSKYGILPEMLRARDLPRANGSILMATFLAIIFGLAAAGAAKQKFETSLWMASLPCLVIAVTGLITSLAIRPTAVAQPGLKFDVSSLAIAPETRALLRTDRKLLGVLLMSSVFWFVGGTIYPPAINATCKEQFHLDYRVSGMFAASTGIGIAIGCMLAGILSKDRVRGWIVRVGACGLTASLLMLALPGPGWEAAREEIRESTRKREGDSRTAETVTFEEALPADQKPEPIAPKFTEDKFYRGTLLGPYGTVAALIAVGLFAGFYSVPLQVYLQTNAPSEQKGRIIAAMNLLNWIGIAGAGLIYDVGRVLLVDTLNLPHATLFGFAAMLMLPVAIFYRPPESPRAA